ncbi:ATP-binding protein [Bdellovibrionota bacterium FG-1]
MLDVIADVLDFSKLEVDKVVFEIESFALHSTIDELVQLLSPQASQKGLTLSYRRTAGVLEWVMGDITRFRQILMNLVANALKFTETGSIEIFAQSEKLENRKMKIQISVRDTGIGIPERLMNSLFVSFSQVDASTTRRFGGSGLGLAISKGLCEEMGGSIWGESVVGQGSVFSFTVIVAEAVALRAEEIIHSVWTFDHEMGKQYPLRILVAEDNRGNQLVAVGFLDRLGYQADIAANGVEVLECLQRRSYDLILMDCHMPQLDGFMATQRIVEKYGKWERPRIVALSASSMKEDIDHCFASGMDGFMEKPITVESLVRVLKECRPHVLIKKTGS